MALQSLDLGGNDLVIGDLYTGATRPGQVGSKLTASTALNAVTPGTVSASKALVVDSSSNISTINAATITTLTSTLVTTPAVTSGTNLALNGTSTGTIAIGNVSTGAVTITPATTVTGVLTATAGISIPTAGTIKVAPVALTGSSHAATMTGHYAAIYTTESLTTAAAGTQAEVITLTGVAAGDIALVNLCGGTALVSGVTVSAVCTTNTITVTVLNGNGSSLSGTIKFNVVWLKQ